MTDHADGLKQAILSSSVKELWQQRALAKELRQKSQLGQLAGAFIAGFVAVSAGNPEAVAGDPAVEDFPQRQRAGNVEHNCQRPQQYERA